MKTLKDAWTFDIECVKIMKKILRGSSTYHKNHVSIILIGLGDMARACHSLSRPHFPTTPTNSLSSPIIFKKTLPRPPCLLSPSELMARLPLSPSPTKLFLAPPQFQLQVGSRQHALFRIVCFTGLPRPPLKFPAIEYIRRHLYFIPIHTFSQRAPYL